MFKNFSIKNIKYLIFLLPAIAIANNDIDVAFSPKGGSLELVLKAINSSKKSICMATYSFTSKPVAEAILAAKNRGVDVKVVSDEKANDRKYTATRFLANNNVSVRLNGNYAIMHNKFIVVDNQTVETGSFNYSSGAVNKNAENVIVIWNNPDIAQKYSNECVRLYNEATILSKAY